MINNDTWYRCTVCGREGRVGRCCGDETREPLNDLAREEQASIKKTAQNSDYTKLKDALETIAEYGGSLTGEDAHEMKQMAIEALQ